MANDLGEGTQVALRGSVGRSGGGGGGNIFMEAWYGLFGVKSPAAERAEAERTDEEILNRGGSFPGTYQNSSGKGSGISESAGSGKESSADNTDDKVDSFEAQSEYLRYKDFCNSPPPPTGDICKDRREKIKWLQGCRDMRQQWDNRYRPGRHADDISVLDKSIKKEIKRYNNSWDCRGQPLD